MENFKEPSSGTEISTEETVKYDEHNPTTEGRPMTFDTTEEKALAIKMLTIQAIETLPSYQFEQIVVYIKNDNLLITQWLEGEWNAFKTLRQLVIDLVKNNKFVRQMLQEHLLKMQEDGTIVIQNDWE
ncbi:hypothetical protein NHQ30_008759 [Ciborinia camelliae]|nr:hypothetical protein NHQ30_008759 [Ciborinia camelliae]